MVRSDVSQIDARLESRVHAIMTSALGDTFLAERTRHDGVHAALEPRIDLRDVAADYAAAAGKSGILDDRPRPLVHRRRKLLAYGRRVFGMQLHPDIARRRGELPKRFADDGDHLGGIDLQLAARQLLADGQRKLRQLALDLGVELMQRAAEELQYRVELLHARLQLGEARLSLQLRLGQPRLVAARLHFLAGGALGALVVPRAAHDGAVHLGHRPSLDGKRAGRGGAARIRHTLRPCRRAGSCPLPRACGRCPESPSVPPPPRRCAPAPWPPGRP